MIDIIPVGKCNCYYASSSLSKDSKEKLKLLDIKTDDLCVLNDISVIYIYCNEDKNKFYIGQTNSFIRRHCEHINEINNNVNGIDYINIFSGGNIILFYGEDVSANLNYIENRLIKIFSDYKTIFDFSLENREDGHKSDLIQGKREDLDKLIYEILKKIIPVLGWNKNYDFSFKAFTSVLYRHSPFYELEDKQKEVFDKIKNSKDESSEKLFIIRGAAGTGKTVLMNHIIAHFYGLNINRESNTPMLNVGVCIKSNMFKSTKNIFKVYGTKLENSGIYINNWKKILETFEDKKGVFDYIIIDEAQRLNKYCVDLNPVSRKFLENNEKNNVLNLMLYKTKKLIIFYDETQSIRKTDIDYIGSKNNYNNIYKFPIQSAIYDTKLISQYRIKIKSDSKSYNTIVSDNYIKWIKYILQIRDIDKNNPSSINKDFLNTDYFHLVDSINDLQNYINEKQRSFPFKKTRIIAGYYKSQSHKWISLDDMEWNKNYLEWSASNEDNVKKQIGNIHSVQGFEFDFIGLIIGDDLKINDKDKLVVDRECYKDKNGKKKCTDDELLTFIKNIYYVLLTRAIYGICVYVEDENLRKYFKTESMNQSIVSDF